MGPLMLGEIVERRVDTMKFVNVGNALKVTCVGFAAGLLLRVVQML